MLVGWHLILWLEPLVWWTSYTLFPIIAEDVEFDIVAEYDLRPLLFVPVAIGIANAKCASLFIIDINSFCTGMCEFKRHHSDDINCAFADVIKLKLLLGHLAS